MAEKVFACFALTVLVWLGAFLVLMMIFCAVFDMHPANPQYAELLHINHVISYALMIPSAIIGFVLMKKGWWD